MDTTNEANYIKWLLTDQMIDIVAAVSMGREIINQFKESRLTTQQAMGRLRVCNHSITLTLFKLHELRKKYGKFLSTLPREETAGLFKDAADIESKKICKFRNSYAAHIFDKDTLKPISMQKGEELLNSITGKDNDQCEAFYDWLYPLGWSIEKPCVVSSIERLRAYCRQLPGGELERP